MVALVSAQRARSLIAALSRDVPDFPSPGVLFRDLTPVRSIPGLKVHEG